MHKGNTAPEEDLLAGDKTKSVLEWNFDEVLSFFFSKSRSESDMVLEILPDFIGVGESFILHTTLLSEELEHILRCTAVESMVEQPCLLSGKPSSEVVVPAVSEAADEVTDIIVLPSFDHI